MNTSQLLGRRVALRISDPWEFGTECGGGPFFGHLLDFGNKKILGVDVERALVGLDPPIKYQGASYSAARCDVRHEGTSFYDLNTESRIPVNITLLPAKVTTFSDVDNHLFRRGFLATGSLQFA